MSDTGVLCCSGVLQPDNRSDGIGDVAEILDRIPGVGVFLRRITKQRMQPGDLKQAANRDAKLLMPFDRIIVVGHSRGGLYVVDAARYLQKLGRDVHAMFLADAWHGQHTIVIPANVQFCEAWTQDNGLINGSEIKLADKRATIFESHDVDVGHNQVDSWPAFHAAVLQRVRAAT